MAATSAGRLSSCARVMADSVAQAYLSSRIRLEQLRAAPVLAEQVLGQKCEDALVPDPDVTWLEYPVVLVREIQELRALAAARQVRVHPQGLGDRHPVVPVTVNDQQRRGNGVRVQVRRVREIPLWLGSRMPENPAPVRGVVGRAEHLVKRPKARVAD